LPWENDGKETEAERVSRAIKDRLSGGERSKRNGKKPALKKKNAKPLALESQFDIGSGPRCSEWWNLFEDGINNSGIGLWLSCRHQFWLRYVCGYNVSVYNDSIEFGNIFHWLIERWLRGKLRFPEVELRTRYHPKWLKGFGTLTPQNKQTQETFYALAAAMWPVYARKYKADLFTNNFGVEVQFDVKHRLWDHKGKPVLIRLYGTIDRLFSDSSGGRHLVDHKTSSWINEGEIAAALPLNFQLMYYAYADFLKTGKIVSSTAHDMIRRTSAKPNKKTHESIAKYAKRIGKEVEKEPDYYFNRIPTPVNRVKLEAYRDNIINPIICDLAEWASGRGPHYPNPNAIIGRYGPCSLFGPITQNNFAGLPRKRPTTRGVER
jgi:hypothetical protein